MQVFGIEFFNGRAYYLSRGHGHGHGHGHGQAKGSEPVALTLWSATHELFVEFDAGYTFVGNDSSIFYFLTDFDAPMGRLIAVNLTRPARADWEEIISESPDALQNVSLVGDMFIASYLHDAHALVKVFDLKGRLVRTVELPGIGTVMGFDGRREDRETFYLFTGFTTPGTVFHYDVESGLSTVYRKPKTSFDSDRTVTKQVFYESKRILLQFEYYTYPY